jgi:hypothetical protein
MPCSPFASSLEAPSNNCFGPVWSLDGSQIVFEIFVENHWRLGLLNGDGSGFRFFEMPLRGPGMVVGHLGARW